MTLAKGLKQILGTAIGVEFAPPYAWIFMKQVETESPKTQEHKPLVWFRCIDDVFFIWTHGKGTLCLFLKDLNCFHRNIKSSHEVNKKSIQFLDLNIRLSDGNVSIDLYVKPTGRHQFIHYTSSRPDHTKRSIVFSQELRVSRICSEKSDFLKHLEKMKSWFLVRGYPEYLIESDVKKVKFASKNRNTKRAKSFKAIPFVMTYHPKLNSLKEIILKYLDLFYMGDKVKRVFTHKHMISFRKARKLSKYLVRAKLYLTERIVGSCKCGRKRFEVFINVNETSTFTSTMAGETYIINLRFDCNGIYLVYLLTWNKCKMQYVGQTLDQFWSRWNF